MSRHEGFAPIPTWMIRDAKVSAYALLVYAALSSRSGLREITPGRETLAREARCSVRQVARALIELEELGVIQRARRKNATGRAPSGYTLHPNGRLTVEDSESLTPEVEDSGDRGSGLWEQGFGTEDASTPLKGRDSQAEIVKAESFDDFWSVWPRKDSKKTAEKAWASAIKRADASVIISAARAYAESPGRPEKKFVPYAATWLNGDRWTDPVPERDGSSSNDRLFADLEFAKRFAS